MAVFLRLYTNATIWWNDLKVRFEDERGATAVEYALMVALIAIVIVAVVAFVGQSVSSKFDTVGSGVQNA